MEILQTARLRLRLFRDSDLDAYADMCADAEVMRFIGERRPMTRSEAWRSMAMMHGHYHLRGCGLWCAEDKASGEMVGRIGIWQPEGWPGLEAAWTLRRQHWGKGYASEAARAVIDYAFRVHNAPHIISLIDPANAASLRVAQRVGERFEGTTEIYGHVAHIYGIARP